MGGKLTGNDQALSTSDKNLKADKSTYCSSPSRKDYGPNEKQRILKNLICLGLVFILIFTAYGATANLQSSINAEAGLGPYSLAALYVGNCISSIFLPSFMLKRFKCKNTIILSISGYAVYIAAQFYPRFETLIPSGFMLGICAAPLWAAQSTFVSKIAEEYAYLISEAAESVLQRFFGIFYLIVATSNIWGNLILSFILSTSHELESPSEYSKETRSLAHCGANFCPAVVSARSFLNITKAPVTPPDPMKMMTLTAIFLGSTLTSIILLCLLIDPLSRYGEDDKEENERSRSATDLLFATFKHWSNPLQLLLIPISIWCGLVLGFFGVDFTSGYISCAWGVEYIGYVMMCYGACSATSSFLFGTIIKFIGRPPVFMLAVAINIGCSIWMLLWEPTSRQPWFFFVMAGLWGVTDGIYLPQINALYSSIFRTTKEAGFSNIRLWQSIGFIIAYVNGTRICMETKIYIGIIVATISIIGYLIVEIVIRSRKGDTPKKTALSQS